MTDSKAMEPNIEREATAYHEAGHAVAGFALKRAFRKVTIVSDDISVGRCSFVARPFKENTETRDVHTKVRYIMERKAMTSLAGWEAEKLFYQNCISTGRVPKHFDVQARCFPGSETDYKHAENYLGVLAYSDENELIAYLEWLTHRVRVILQEHWRAVVALADQLLEVDTILKREGIALIRSAMTDISNEYLVESQDKNPISFSAKDIESLYDIVD